VFNLFLSTKTLPSFFFSFVGPPLRGYCSCLPFLPPNDSLMRHLGKTPGPYLLFPFILRMRVFNQISPPIQKRSSPPSLWHFLFCVSCPHLSSSPDFLAPSSFWLSPHQVFPIRNIPYPPPPPGIHNPGPPQIKVHSEHFRGHFPSLF